MATQQVLGNILAIGAHPDDIEIGCGGTLIKLNAMGYKIYQILMTEGTEEIGFQGRSEEQCLASELMGIQSVFRPKLMDTRIELKDAIRTIEPVLERIQPEYVFTHFYQDTHQDHKVVHDATVSACRNRGNILFYETLSTEMFFPTIHVDIHETIDQKVKCIRAHLSQESRLNIVNFVKNMASLRSHRTDMQHVEGFTPRKLKIFAAEAEMHAIPSH